ncbi:twin-arginine translocase TatA/TatE family subunit [Ilumatobacter sp.]|uniref:twin-arginine translocase TatA/TatE family subunit n=1 Tax=Ilumatobacter sp. TaxID=1967498 RepID=UPI003AF6F7E0
MFNLQGSEIVIVLLLALVVLGPEKLPDAMRKMGQFYAELKKMSSGFQSEFRSAIDEPMQEIRDTANVLRDSADLTKLQNGEREEKPKSAEMGSVADPDAVPAESVSDFERPSADTASAEPELAADSKPSPFSGESSAAPRIAPVLGGEAAGDARPADAAAPGADVVPPAPGRAADSKPSPFSGRSSAAPRPRVASSPSDDVPVGDPSEDAAAATDGAPSGDAEDESVGADRPTGADDAAGRAR